MIESIEGCVDISPREVNYDPKMVRAIENHFYRRIKNTTLQGAGFLMARHGKVFAHKAMGRLSHKSKTALLQPDSLKGVASITKVFTATAIMKLIEDGVLWLDQAVKDVLPEFDTSMHCGITLKHLLTHTSGLMADPGYFTEPYQVPIFDSLGSKDWLIKGPLLGPMQSKPGEVWSYSSFGYAALGEVVTRAAKKHYSDYVQQNIFNPLGMKRSFFNVPQSLRSQLITAHDSQIKRLTLSARKTGAPPSLGGAFSTMPDLFRFAQCFLNGGILDGFKLLSKKTVAEMTRNQLVGVPAFHWGKHLKNFRYGLGFGFFCDGSLVGEATFNHEGSGWSSVFIDPVETFIYISFMANADDWDPEIMVKPRTMAFAGIE